MGIITSLLFVIGCLLAPTLTIPLVGAHVLAGGWTLPNALAVCWGLRLLHTRNVRTSKRGWLRHMALTGFVTSVLLLLGYACAYLFHVMMPPATARFAGVVWLVLALLWVLPDSRLPRLERVKSSLPVFQFMPLYARLLTVALLSIPWWLPAHTGKDDPLGDELRERRLILAADTVRWVDKHPRGLQAALVGARVLLLAGPEGGPNDVYLAQLGFSVWGNPRRVISLHNLTDTAVADERQLAVRGRWGVWEVSVSGKPQAVEMADLSGEAVGAGATWNRLTRFQRRVTNWQETGQFRGIGRKSIRFPETESGPVDVTWKEDQGELLFTFGDAQVRTSIGRELSDEAAQAGLMLVAAEVPRPGDLTTWAVDRVRAIDAIGSEGMQWLKAVAFRAADEVEQLEAEYIGIDAEKVISEELGQVLEHLPILQNSAVPNWPPDPLEPVVTPALAGEGAWVDLARDVIVPGARGAPSPFVFTFIRVDPKRPYNQVSITLWDPRQVELHIVAGSVEPKSMTGDIGTGLIPRDPRVMRRLVAAFNGAFQAMHGEYGMMENRRIQLPPKPFAATVATFDDGVARFGTWPGEPAVIPKAMRSLRQNMTPLVVGTTANPYNRNWWGGVPEGWAEETRTVRSALCRTNQAYIAYFYSPSVDPDRLADAMLRAGCSYGFHLDMNAGHTGFEFYRVAPRSELPTLNRPLDPFGEAQGRVSGLGEYSFFSRLMLRKMPLMQFPRYIHQTPRDFFYLTRRHLLPRPNLEPALELSFGDWLLPAFTQGEWPHAIAQANVTTTGSGPRRAFLISELDPKHLSLEGGEQYIGLHQGRPEGDLGLKLERTGFSLVPLSAAGSESTSSPHHKDAQILATGYADPGSDRGVICVTHDATLMVVEAQTGSRFSAQELEMTLERLDCKSRLFTSSPVTLHSSGTSKGDPKQKTHLASVPKGTRWLSRKSFRGVDDLYPETPILPITEWAIPQARRVPLPAFE